MFYRIGEVAKILHISTKSLRRWEASGLIPLADRSPVGHREYYEEDIESIRAFLQSRGE